MFQHIITFLIILIIQSANGAGHVKTAYVDFDGKGAEGQIIFMDDGDSVLIMTHFPSLPDNGGLSYHVHNWPVDYTLSPDTRCGSEYVGGHYDPYGKQATHGANYSTACANDKSECEVGDLSGKHNPLRPCVENTDVDTFGLSLSNFHSILFRSIVIHRSDGSRLTCATIRPDTPSDIITGRARFNGPKIGGSIRFFQPNSTARDTYIFVDLFLNYPGAELADNLWSIKINPTGTDGRRGECDRAGDTSFTTRTGNITCDNSDASTCHEHQLTEKHDTLTIGCASCGGNRRSFSEYDGITLSGDNSIIGLSIRIESATAELLGCATIKRTRFIRATADFNSYAIYAIEYSPFLPTHIKHTGDASSITNQWIHTQGYYPERACNASLQTYSPFPLFVPGASVNATQDIYAVGNLVDSLTDAWVWQNTLPLSGPYSTIGRTVSINWGGDWVCSDWQDDFTYRGDDDSYIYKARAVFSPGPCWVSFTQRVSSNTYEPQTFTGITLPDFDSGEVTIFDYCPSGPSTRRYRIQTGTTRVADTTTFNPYWVSSYGFDSSDYSANCGNYRSERCEVGDLERLNLQDNDWIGIHTNLEMLGRFQATYNALQMYDSVDGSVDEVVYIEPVYSSPFTACASSCEVANMESYTLSQPHILADLTCELNSASTTCDDGEYEVNGIATGATAADATMNSALLTNIYNAGCCLQGTTCLFILLLLLSLLFMY